MNTRTEMYQDINYFLCDIATNYDHDADAHKYDTRCRVCEAEKLLWKYRARLDEEAGYHG